MKHYLVELIEEKIQRTLSEEKWRLDPDNRRMSARSKAISGGPEQRKDLEEDMEESNNHTLQKDIKLCDSHLNGLRITAEVILSRFFLIPGVGQVGM